MRRRDILLLGAAALVTPRLAGAQEPERVRRIGYFTADTGSPDNLFGVEQTRALIGGLREFGWFDGRNISLEHRFSGGGRERMQANARDLVASNPDVIVGAGGLQLGALLAATHTIPIVFTNVSDPVGSGFVASLARPGGNATGIGVNEAPLAGKWLQLLKEIAPGITHALVPIAAASRPQQLQANAVAAAAPGLGLTVSVATVSEPADYDREIAAFAQLPGGGIVVLSNPIVAGNYARVHALAAQYRLPAIYSYPIYARTGGLVSYGPDTVALFHEVARYVDQILRGAKPGDLPVMQPTRFVLAVNLKTAKSIGLTVPQSVLARADEVIE
ncbi:MAG TPA: ABC transporter substrate-binding protein [Stellaceae bacterium]|jgi:putative ABC transport system substrate-binding protein